MAHLLRIDGPSSTPLTESTMIELGLQETTHLERWIVDHPEVLDPTLRVITTQFGRWSSVMDTARERPDVLALSDSGEVAVVELKRGGDAQVHLQALTYAALAAGFTKEVLADAHARWLTRRAPGEPPVTSEDALARLVEHVQSDWSEDLLTLPRIILVAEDFPAQVLTTVQWLAAVAPDVTIECHEYHVFVDAGGAHFASFQRIFPVDDLEERRLRPTLFDSAGEVRERIASNKRRAKSVTIIAESQAIPEGAPLRLDLESLVKSDVVQIVNTWLDEEDLRRKVTWTNHPTYPLVWAVEPEARWTPSSLRNRIFDEAAGYAPSFSAADAWTYEGRNLYTIASDLMAEAEAP